MIIDGFKEEDERSEITYVVARYRVIDAHWYPYGEFENIEEAQEKLEDLSRKKRGKYAIFERIRSEILTKLN